MTKLSKEMRNDFIEGLVENSSIIKDIRRVNMRKSELEIPLMSLGVGTIRATTQEPVYSSVTLQTSKLVLPWTATEDFFSDNPEKGAADKRIFSMMAIQASNDMEDLLINGDEGSSDVLLRSNDGILKLAKNNYSIKVGIRGKRARSMFEEMLRALPIKYRGNLRQLCFYVSPDTWMDYIESLTTSIGTLSNDFVANLTYGGVRLVVSPHMPDDKIILTHPDNILLGVQNDMDLVKKHNKKDKMHEYKLMISTDFAIQDPDALVVGTVTTTLASRLYTRAMKNKFGKAVLSPLGVLYRFTVRKSARKLARLLNRLARLLNRL